MIRQLSRFAISAALVVALQGCGDKKQEATEQPVRGLRAYKVAANAESRARRFPSVLQPRCQQPLVRNRRQLKAVTLTVGQKVQLGDMLAEIDPRSLQTQSRPGQRGVQQAQAQLDNAESDFQRKEELLKRGVATQAVFDQSKATLLRRQDCRHARGFAQGRRSKSSGPKPSRSRPSRWSSGSTTASPD